MTLLNTVNVGGTDFGLLNNAVIGTCATPAGSEVKACTFADSFELKAGVVVAVAFTYANTYGDGSTTYPKLSVNGASYPIKYATNAYAGAGAWINGQTVPFMFNGDSFILVANLMQTSVISASSTTVNGAPLYNGANVKVMFTSALTGSDTSTALVINYNGTNITVKVPVNGALADYTAKAVDVSGTTVYYYCQAYTTLELMFDGTQFIILENPTVISNADYTIYADGSKKYNDKGVFVYFPCVTYPTLSQYNGQNIPGLIVGSTEKTSPWVMLITAKEINSNKFITYIYTFSNTNTFTLTVLSAKDITIKTTNGFGFISYNGFDNTKEHLTTVQVLA